MAGSSRNLLISRLAALIAQLGSSDHQWRRRVAAAAASAHRAAASSWRLGAASRRRQRIVSIFGGA